MTAYAKHLPTGTAPASDLRTWGVPLAERWSRARAPLFFAPAGGSWVLGALVVLAFVLILGDEGAGPAGGADWRYYPDAVLLAALPLWFRLLPAATAVSAALLAVEAALAPAARTAPHTAGRTGALLVCGLSLWALTGALLRLRARRAQERPVLEAAGPARFPLPERLPVGHRRRGLPWIPLGALLCLFAVPVLLAALGASAPGDAVDGQRIALLPLVLGTTALGRGSAAALAARRLRGRPQPALIVGIRIAPSGHHWILPDADTTSGRPLVAFRPGGRDTLTEVRLLSGGAGAVAGRPPRGLHDIDARAEPFEAVLYGVPREGAEVLLEYAVHEGRHIGSSLTAVPLLPRRRHRFDQWNPAGVSHRDTTASRLARAAERRREAEARRREEQRRGRAEGGAAATAGGCGGGDGGCGGGSCGGCGGCGCG
ncbi:hypothetical protein AB0P15_24895 [Streptomyces sp. NPDC087917]|uniref:hypothetical protein n=1 Tax=unclassified Streptomyces TaxID=2593676 RepID=UPI00341E333E